jgi:hypothetical protein
MVANIVFYVTEESVLDTSLAKPQAVVPVDSDVTQTLSPFGLRISS